VTLHVVNTDWNCYEESK